MGFWNQKHAAWRDFHAIYRVLAAQFFVPAIGYLFLPDLALAEVDRIAGLLGGPPLSPEEGRSDLWRFLSFSNVFALAAMCWMIERDLRRNAAVLTALLILKGGSAFGAAWVFLVQEHHPFHLFVVALDGGTAFLIWWSARRALALLGRVPDAELVPPPRP
jgi:hypothetical protein